MRANTLKGLAAADVVINVPLERIRLARLAAVPGAHPRGLQRGRGHEGRAAAACRGRGGVGGVARRAGRRQRRRRFRCRRSSTSSGAGASDDGGHAPGAGRSCRPPARRRRARGHAHRARRAGPLRVARRGRSSSARGATACVVRALPSRTRRRSCFSALSLENTTSNKFRFGLERTLSRVRRRRVGLGAARGRRGGSDPSAGVALYRPLWSTPLFVEPSAADRARTLNVIEEDTGIAAYHQSRTVLGADVGVNLGRDQRGRGPACDGAASTRKSRSAIPGLPELPGQRVASAQIRLDSRLAGQPSRAVATVCTRITRARALPSMRRVPKWRRTARRTASTRSRAGMSWAWSFDLAARNRIFALGGAGTSFGDRPLPTEQFALGGPFG